MQDVQTNRGDRYSDPFRFVQECALKCQVGQRQTLRANAEAYLDPGEPDLLCQLQGFDFGFLSKAPIRRSDLELYWFGPSAGESGRATPAACASGCSCANADELASRDAPRLCSLSLESVN